MLRHPNIIAFRKVRRRRRRHGLRLRSPAAKRQDAHSPSPRQALLTPTHLAIVMEYAAGARARLRARESGC